MGKKGGPRQDGKPAPVPNKELLQRMNFLHQAAVLVSQAVYDPTARVSTSSTTDRQKAGTAAERGKQKRTKGLAEDMARKKTVINTQPIITAQVNALPATKHYAALTRAIEHENEANGFTQTNKYREHLKALGYDAQTIETRVRQRRKRYVRKLAKEKLAPLQLGSASISAPPVASTSSNAFKLRSEVIKPKHPAQVEKRNLAAHYVNDIRTIAKKSVLRLDPNIKRNMCRNCNALLIPGVTSSIKVLPSKTHVHLIRTRCLACNVARTIPSPPLLPDADGAQGSLDTPRDAEVDVQAESLSDSEAMSRTLSEQSAMQEDVSEIAVPLGDIENILQSDTVLVDMLASTKEEAAKEEAKQRRQKFLDDTIVPGRKRQYVRRRFHESPIHKITSGNASQVVSK